MSRLNVMVLLVGLIVLGIAFGAYAQVPAAAPAAGQAPAAARAPAAPPVRPALFFREDWQQTPANDEHPATQQSVGNPKLELKTYGPSAKEWLLTGTKENAQNPTHLWNGMCALSCFMTLRDRTQNVDLSGQAKVRWVTKISNFQRIHPVVKLADGNFYVGDYSGGSMTDWRQEEFFFSELKWVKLDPARNVATGAVVAKVDLSNVEEFGWTDLMNSSGHGQGGWSDVATIELYGKPVARTAAAPTASKN